MGDRETTKYPNQPETDERPKPAGQDVGPPEERVDDEMGHDERKTTKRQE